VFLINHIEIMVAKSYFSSQYHSDPHLRFQKMQLEENYRFLKVSISENILTCNGSFKPTDFSPTYQYRIRYIYPIPPIVHVISPVIEFNDEIHMYKDGSLCLYYPKDMSWNSRSLISNTIVPWTHEWFVFYEIYKITGKWHHPSVHHQRPQNYGN
jgi:hypothetical protein